VVKLAATSRASQSWQDRFDPAPFISTESVCHCDGAVVVQFDVEAALRRHLVRQLTDKLTPTKSNCTITGCWGLAPKRCTILEL
jgi:hypothetical protein